MSARLAFPARRAFAKAGTKQDHRGEDNLPRRQRVRIGKAIQRSLRPDGCLVMAIVGNLAPRLADNQLDQRFATFVAP